MHLSSSNNCIQSIFVFHSRKFLLLSSSTGKVFGRQPSKIAKHLQQNNEQTQSIQKDDNLFFLDPVQQPLFRRHLFVCTGRTINCFSFSECFGKATIYRNCTQASVNSKAFFREWQKSQLPWKSQFPKKTLLINLSLYYLAEFR